MTSRSITPPDSYSRAPSSFGGSMLSLTASSMFSMPSIDNLSPRPPSCLDFASGNNNTTTNGSPNSFEEGENADGGLGSITDDEMMLLMGREQQQQQQQSQVARFWAKTYDGNYGLVFSGHVSIVMNDTLLNASSSSGGHTQPEPVVRISYEAMEQLHAVEACTVYNSRWDYNTRIVDYPMASVVACKLAVKRCEVKLLLEPPSRPVTIMFDKPEVMFGFWELLGTHPNIPPAYHQQDVPLDQVTGSMSIEEMLARKEAYFFVKREFPNYRTSMLWDGIMVSSVICADLEQDYRKNIGTLNEENVDMPPETDVEAFRLAAQEVLKRCWARHNHETQQEQNIRKESDAGSSTSGMSCQSMTSKLPISPSFSPSPGKHQSRIHRASSDYNNTSVQN